MQCYIHLIVVTLSYQKGKLKNKEQKTVSDCQKTNIAANHWKYILRKRQFIVLSDKMLGLCVAALTRGFYACPAILKAEKPLRTNVETRENVLN